jgi:adsorption protein B
VLFVCLLAWILLSGLDDLFVGLIFLLNRRQPFRWPAAAELDARPERRIAILVPLWREHGVIRQMLDRNLSIIQYQDYDIFAGVYPNDEPTINAVRDAANRHPRVHLAMGAHDGPTSKGGCLNWTYRRMTEYEAAHGVRFEIVVTHDAEDLVHRDSLRLINWFSRDYEMVQVPVLPISTGLGEITHGLYCDEFAEFQSKDIPARQHLGGFLPGNGVGTGYLRVALDRLAAQRHGRVFDPASLTEDYETGYRLHALGCRQIFLPIRFDAGAPVATREYFPRNFRSALRQRSRWVAGISLQGWERHGWRAPRRQLYWFWRDRKGLIGNLIAPIANLYWFAGALDLIAVAPWAKPLHAAAAATCLLQVCLRTWCSMRLYSWQFATGVPVRMVWGNVVNCLATVEALRHFFVARYHRRAPAWRKTEHAFPAFCAPAEGRPQLGEVLVRMRLLSLDQLEQALKSCPVGARLGEHLVQLQRISEDDLYQALSSQSGIPLGMPRPREVVRRVTRTLSAAAARRWKVLPYRVRIGQIHVVTAELPSPEMLRELSLLLAMEVRFRLVRPHEFEAMALEYLPSV